MHPDLPDRTRTSRPARREAQPDRRLRAQTAPIVAGMVAALVAVIVYLGALRGSWSFGEVLRDPAAEFGHPIYAGFVSYLGIAGWLIAATVTALAVAVRPGTARRLGPVCLLSVVLLLDDVLLLHDAVLPRFGIPEMVVLAAIAALAVAAMRPFLPDLRAGRLPGLLCALLLLVASLGVDTLLPSGDGAALFVEDMLKFAGIALWAGFWAQHVTWLLRAR
ncbi:hypothetical protein SAMN05421538_1135 [Paracoccus isoporae]|uniref:Uncharacterized protein n=1 Tax=Paracoccus isoporae TaxID=591205 RepID=A0A1G7GCW6_9RHOB|nr:hypothetical protein [Paracoccus isoporae]SDE85974.1 hypothetical protein SAMN05421538_1135 [Paracoccus isoporae]